MPKEMGRHEHKEHADRTGGMYYRLGTMAALSFVAMFGLMYAMVDRVANVVPNLNQAYMAALMTAPMVILEMLVMGSMYRNRTLNVAILSASVVVLASSWFFIRGQVGISDRQFLKSMIPHHASALLMCRETPLHDPEIQRLCDGIVSSQQKEIDFMKAKLRAEDRGR
jgi:Domain of unknown function (DUF305)